MSCHPASTWARYLAGQLSREQSRTVESHLVQCRRCRELVVSLREPDTDPAGAQASAPGRAAPASRRAIALPLTLVGLAGAVAVLWALVESELPQLLGGSHPPDTGWGGAYAMAIDLVFVLRESAPTLFELALPVAAMATVSALLSFALSALRRRIGDPGAKVLAALALLVLPAEGRAHFGLHEHEELLVAAGTVHPGTLVASARSVTIDGVVDGDLVVLTERLVLRGEIAGNVFAVARDADLRGVVNGSLFLGGERSTLAGEVRGDVYSAGESFVLAPGGRIERDATLVAEGVLIEGELGRDVNALFTERIEARGSIGRDLRGRAGQILLAEGARIGRDVDASLPEGVAIERRAGVLVGGEIRMAPRETEWRSPLSDFFELEVYAWMLLHVGAGFVLGMLLHWLAPGVLAVRADGPRDLVRGFGIGLVAVVAVPVALAIAALTVVGLPVALFGAAGFAAALYTGLVALAAHIGASLVHPRAESRTGFGAALALGLVILTLLTHLPFLGGPLRVVVLLVGLGLLVERAREAWRARAQPTTA